MASHYDAVVALLDAAAAVKQFVVHRSHVPSPVVYPYAVLWWPGAPLRDVNSMAGTSGHADIDFQITAVGETEHAVRIVAEAMQDAILDVEVVATGWVTGKIRSRGSRPIDEDRDVTLPVTNRHPLYAVQSYRLGAERA